ncbi:hypothetical protein CSB85_6833 (plasmid) [Pseudomonas aeruginosa]|uniref:hypothetical protein n=1 Tax=Pseudomonas aeruginosa TaxID=287 RepID=UPI000B11BB70|nr:hypothetical protein [Pseudomonas aeruginosa]AVK29725.1 hypothetical protein CSB85_6833 [Pseudomonas aeruginosa]
MLGAAGADGHPLDVIEVDGIHQLLAGQAGRIHRTRSSAPPAPMAFPLDVIEVDGIHQLLAGRAGRIHATRSSALIAAFQIGYTSLGTP